MISEDERFRIECYLRAKERHISETGGDPVLPASIREEYLEERQRAEQQLRDATGPQTPS